VLDVIRPSDQADGAAAAAGQLAPVAQVHGDAQLLELWLHGRSAHTQRAYHADASGFLAFVAKPLRTVSVADVQAWMDTLEHLAPASRARKISSVKSLFAFGHRLGYLSFDVGRVVKRPKLKDTLAERILSEGEVHKLLVTAGQRPARKRTAAQERRARRNYVLLRLLYAGGLRVEEIAGLAWRDLQERGDAGQVTVYGKAGKTRVVLLPAAVWNELLSIKEVGATPDAPVFASRNAGGFLTSTQVRRLVYQAAKEASLDERPSPHWLRHAHATHALERGAPIHLVQATLGHASVATTGRYLHARPTDSSARYLPL
jgi:integrase/recombinase XerD